MNEGIGLFGTKVARTITMKLPENVETETSDKSGFNSRASRMARYSAAAAGVAAVSTLDVDAALVTMDLGSPVGAGTPIELQFPDYAAELRFVHNGPGRSVSSSSYPNGIIAAGSVGSSVSSSLSTNAALVYFGKWFGPNSQIGMSLQAGSYGGEGGSYGGEGGPVLSGSQGSVGWSPFGGYIGPSGTNETLYMGFAALAMYSSSSSSYTSSYWNFGYLQFDFDSAQTATVQHWGYESVFNADVTTPGGSSSVSDTGPGLFGLALLGAGAAGVRLLRKLRSKS